MNEGIVLNCGKIDISSDYRAPGSAGRWAGSGRVVVGLGPGSACR